MILSIADSLKRFSHEGFPVFIQAKRPFKPSVHHEIPQRPMWAHAARLRCSAGTLQGFLRFTDGCYGLPVDVGRGTGVPRLQRVCTKCHGPAVCDERHVVFECPALQHLRDKYSRLFSGSGQTIQQFMWQSDTVGVVCYVRDSLLVLLADDEGSDRSSNQP